MSGSSPPAFFIKAEPSAVLRRLNDLVSLVMLNTVIKSKFCLTDVMFWESFFCVLITHWNVAESRSGNMIWIGWLFFFFLLRQFNTGFTASCECMSSHLSSHKDWIVRQIFFSGAVSGFVLYFWGFLRFSSNFMEACTFMKEKTIPCSLPTKAWQFGVPLHLFVQRIHALNDSGEQGTTRKTILASVNTQ